jgi:hypothetical protein
MAFKVLERYAGKLARTVLRGVGAGNSPRLPDLELPPRTMWQTGNLCGRGACPPTWLIPNFKIQMFTV